MYRQITLDERYLIERLRRQSLSMRAIAEKVGRSPSAISRELNRNVKSIGYWYAGEAQQKSNARRSKSRRKSHFSSETWAFIESKIKEEWSPEQISNWMKEHQM